MHLKAHSLARFTSKVWRKARASVLMAQAVNGMPLFPRKYCSTSPVFSCLTSRGRERRGKLIFSGCLWVCLTGLLRISCLCWGPRIIKRWPTSSKGLFVTRMRITTPTLGVKLQLSGPSTMTSLLILWAPGSKSSTRWSRSMPTQPCSSLNGRPKNTLK